MQSVNSAEGLGLLENVTERTEVLWHKFYSLAINKQSETLLSLVTAKCQLDEDIPHSDQLLFIYELLIKAIENGKDTVTNHLLDLNTANLQALLCIATSNRSSAHVVQLCKMLLERGAVIDSSILSQAEVKLQEILLEFGKSKPQVESKHWRKLCRSAICNRRSEKFLLLLINKCEWVNQTQNSDYGLENLLFIAVDNDWQEAAKQLLDLGANPNSASFQITHGHGPLYVAASKKQVSLCKLLVSGGAVLNSTDHERDPMIQAILSGSVDAAETLLLLGSRCKCNERLTLKTNFGCLIGGRLVPYPQKIINGTLLHYAVTLGDLPIVEFMINRCHADIEIADSNGNTALLLAANRLLPDIVELLLQACQERKLNTVNYMARTTGGRNRRTALSYAINAVKTVDSMFLRRAELKIIESFVKRNVDLGNEFYLTRGRALLVAIRCDQGSLIRDLIRCGLPKQVLSEPCIEVYSCLPMEEALKTNSWNSIVTLIKLDAGIPSRRSLGKPFPHCIIENCSSKVDILQIFNALDGKVDWNAVSRPRTSNTTGSSNRNDGSVLHAAIRNNCDIDVIKYCLAKCIQSINVAEDSEDENGILKLAYDKIYQRDKKLTVCEMLVEAGARLPNSVLNSYFPKNNSYAERKFAEMLVIAGCDIDVRQEYLKKAIESKHWFLSRMLLHTADRACVSSLSYLSGSTKWPDIMQLESQMLAQPSCYVPSMSAVARQVIRQQLRLHTAGSSIIPASFRLPLPRRLQQYILLADISRCTVDPNFPHHCSFPDTCDNNIEQEGNAVHISTYAYRAAQLRLHYYNRPYYGIYSSDDWNGENYYDDDDNDRNY